MPFLSSPHSPAWKRVLAALPLAAMLAASVRGHAADAPVAPWKIGEPIVSYWAGPGYPGGADLTDAAAAQMAEGGWNLVWCREAELDVVRRNGLRGIITSNVLSTSPGVASPAEDSAFTLDPPVSDMPYTAGQHVEGVILSQFGSASAGKATAAMVVNLDYKSERDVGVTGPAAMETFDATTGKWLPADGPHVQLHLPPGGGKLVRLRR